MDGTAHPRVSSDRRSTASREELLRRVRGEFDEMPCLRLTCGQARLLFGLRHDVCERVLATLVQKHILTCGPDGRYRLTDDVRLGGRAFHDMGVRKTSSSAR